jgi:hypothetical protein
MNSLRRFLLGTIAASAIASGLPAFAATGAAVAGGPSIDALVDLGFAALGQIDKGQAGVVWAGSSPVLKAQIPRDEFERRINELMNSVPVSSDRTWLSVSRTTLASDPASRAPGGNYVNIVFVTPAAAGNSRYELLSFRQESANTWQISGYVPSIRAPSN